MLTMKSLSGFHLVIIIISTTDLCVGDSVLLKQFYFVDLSVDWTEAQTYCREYYTDLATIASTEEADQTVGYGGVWIGLYFDTGSKVWKWSGGQAVNFTNWPGESSHTSGCAYLSRNGEWHSSSCYYTNPFMCYNEELILVRDNKTWLEAVEHCRALGTNLSLTSDYSSLDNLYDLPSFQPDEHYPYARTMVQEMALTPQVWTGLRFVGGYWMWVNGDQLQYEDLPVCPGTEQCGTLPKYGGQFEISDCDQKMNFLCSKNI